MTRTYRYLIERDKHTHFKDIQAINDVHASVLADLDDEIVLDEHGAPILFRQLGDTWTEVILERSNHEYIS